MNRWKSFRISLLAITFGGVLFVLGKSILYPNAGKRTVTFFAFPATVSLPEWQFSASSSLTSQIPEGAKEISGRRYRYIQKGLPLNVEIRYLVKNPSDDRAFGSVSTWSKKYIGIPLSRDLQPDITSTKGVGFYGLFVHQGQAYLSACINPHGDSTFTYKQFKHNRYINDVRFDRLFLWLLGKAKLRDERCLWTQLSVPLNSSSPENAYQTLEKAWVSWYKLWKPRFPNL